MTDAYLQGVDAYNRGDAPERNPFDDYDGQHDEW